MIYFLLNPTSSGGKALKKWKELEPYLLSAGVEYKCIHLKSEGDAGVYAKQLTIEKRPLNLVILGGDGTVNEVVSHMDCFEGVTFAVVPVGSGNDFARALRLPTKPEDCARILLDSCHTRAVNIGRVTSSDGSLDHRFAVSSGFGFDAAVCTACSVSPLKNFLNRIGMGRLIYTFNAVRMLAAQKPAGMRITLDNDQIKHFKKVCFAAAMNTPFEGGGMMMAPKADPEDGMLDLLVVDSVPKWKILLILPLAYSGKHTGFKGVHLLRCRTAVLESDMPLHLHTDGEVAGMYSSITWSVCPDSLHTIVS